MERDDNMTTIAAFMTQDHRRCDGLLAAAEEAADKNDWEKATQQTREFVDAMEHHFTMEEQALFPAFEEQTGITQGPTMVMRGEHQQMRGLLSQMQDATERQDATECLSTIETLLIMMQQHNMKEEGMLYPMCDQQLGDVAEIISRMQQV
jgi:hemerythrin-like domain-containing protein